MTIQIELWALLTFLAGLLLAFFGAAFTGGRILLAQVERRLDERFGAQEKAREEGKSHWDDRFGALEAAVKTATGEAVRIERELLSLKAELPVTYVLREDDIRRQSVIEAKIDGLAVRFETWP
ncbi:hypothetical protein [Thauera sinica]|uniref:hypothetical protein n=1 Tax=Thauera sp. K11 TaxID=2005884 RepID=UPI000BBA5AAD|nr:hypothetical protein [Thauera sp. K11]ATE60153.1 hypothetical protein CCZ27_09520 [Thauera sp. K11]